jgi:DME family drug/metabolite transporter
MRFSSEAERAAMCDAAYADARETMAALYRRLERSDRVAYGMVLAASLLWGTASFLARVAIRNGVEPIDLSSIRTAIGFLLLAGLVLIVQPGAGRVRRGDLAVLAVTGVVGLAGTQLAYYMAIQRMPLALAVLLLYLAPVLTLASVLARRQAVRPQLLLAVATTIGGCYLALGAYDSDLLKLNLVGAALGLLSAVCFATYLTVAAGTVRRYPGWTVPFYNSMFAAVFWVLLRPPWSLPWDRWDVPTLALIVGVATSASFALLISMLALVRLSPTRVILTQTLELLVGAGAAFVFLGETLQPLQIVGAGVVLVGIGFASSVRSTLDGA